MPKTKFESVVFTAIAAWLMVYIMTLYNVALASGNFSNETFLAALEGMWLEYVIIGLCAYFISSRVAKYFAFQIVKPTDRPIVITLAIQVFTVLSQVALASILGVWHSYGFTKEFIPNYITTYCRNFVVAFPVQILAAGPLTRAIFRAIFRRTNGDGERRVEKKLRQEGFAE